MTEELPPGPRMPVLLQTLGTWSRPTAFLERCRARYGRRFTVRLVGQPPMVMISDPQEIKELFLAPPDVLHPGEGARILEPIVGRQSVILLDEEPHLEQRKLMLPAFHGERMQRLAGLMAELAEREVDSWPRDEAISLHPRLQRLTLEIILRAVFGLERGSQLDSLRELLTKVLAFSESPFSLLPPLPSVLARVGPMAGLERLGQQVDELIYALIDERRGEAEAPASRTGGEDVLSLLLAAEHEDGSPMSHEELRDELDAGSDENYLTATINEILRHRPVLPNAEPRLVKQPVEIGGVRYRPGVALFANAYLVHHDPAVYPEPHAFRPERFLENPPGTYTWIPFGGGRRRCLGASFALLEMKIVIRAVLARCELVAVGDRAERTRRRSITISPARGGRVLLRDRIPEQAASSHPAETVPAAA
jgi:cytochrome P450